MEEKISEKKYSWGPLYETLQEMVKNGDELPDEELKQGFELFRKLDEAKNFPEIRQIIYKNMLTKVQQMRLNSPCLDDIIAYVNKKNPLHEITKKGCFDSYLFFNQKKVGRHKLTTACSYGREEIVRLITLQKKNRVMKTAKNALEIACEKGRYNIMLFLLQEYKWIERVHLRSCAIILNSRNETKLIKTLLEYGLKPDTSFCGLRNKDLELVEASVKKGMDIGYFIRTVVYDSKYQDDIEFLQYILNLTNETCADNRSVHRPLEGNIELNHFSQKNIPTLETIQFLVKNGATISLGNVNSTYTYVHMDEPYFLLPYLCKNGPYDILGYLLDTFPQIHEYVRTRIKNIKGVKLLYERGIPIIFSNLYATDRYNLSPISLAGDDLEWCITHGWDKNAALACVLTAGSLHDIEFLLRKGATLVSKNFRREAPLTEDSKVAQILDMLFRHNVIRLSSE